MENKNLMLKEETELQLDQNQELTSESSIVVRNKNEVEEKYQIDIEYQDEPNELHE